MDKKNFNRISILKNKINSLPKGSIVQKTIKGKNYYYHQYYEKGKLISKYIRFVELNDLQNKFLEKEALEKELNAILSGEDYSHFYCDLMHKDDRVVKLFVNKQTGKIEKICDVFDNKLLPIGTTDKKRSIDQFKFREWWESRSIPATRDNIKEVMDLLNVDNLLALVVKCNGLSLTDQYWIKPVSEDLKWRDINFFDNDFSNDIGNIIYRKKTPNKETKYDSPESTSTGNLKKRWDIFDDQRVLIKSGTNPFKQEPINEYVASAVAKALDIPCVSYGLLPNPNDPQSICLDFIKKDEDFVSAFQIMKVLQRDNNTSIYDHFIRCCKYLKIPSYKDYLNKMLVFDFIIANEDRHMNNFGFIRNVYGKKEFYSAPIFDNGNSFGFNKIESQMDDFDNIEFKPFYSNYKKLLNLVDDYSWLSVDKLVKVKKIIKDRFADYKTDYLTENRINQIVEASFKRIDYLIKIISK